MIFSGFLSFDKMQAQNTGDGVDEMVSELLDLKIKMTKKNELGGRYKIQLGSFSSLERAEETIKDFESDYKELPASLQYESPHYKVWVGDFTTRISADRVFMELKKDYKSAFIFKPSY